MVFNRIIISWNFTSLVDGQENRKENPPDKHFLVCVFMDETSKINVETSEIKNQKNLPLIYESLLHQNNIIFVFVEIVLNSLHRNSYRLSLLIV